MIHKRLFIFIAIFILLLNSCNSSKKILTNLEKKSLSINITNNPKTLNPIYAVDEAAVNVIRHINEGLIILDENSKPKPGIAKEWTISPSQLKYTFTLKNTTWSDGTPLTAYDFAYTFENILNPENKSKNVKSLFILKNAKEYYDGQVPIKDVGFYAIDENTLEIMLEYPAPYFLQLLATTPFMPVNKKFSENHSLSFGKNSLDTLSNGPWLIKEWLYDNKIVLEKNNLYWNSEKIKLSTINLFIIYDSKKTIDEFTSENLDIAIINNKFVPYAKGKGFTPSPYPEGSTYFIEFNLKRNIIGDVNIRKSLYSSLDRKFLAKGAHNKINEVANTFTHGGIIGRLDLFSLEVGNITRVFSKELANKFYQDGLKTLKLKKLPSLDFIYKNNESDRIDAKTIQKNWEEILGISINMLPKLNEEFNISLKKGNFDIALVSWKGSYNDPESYLKVFQTNGLFNHTSYSNELYDEAIKKIKDNTSLIDRFKMLKELEIDLSIDLPIIPLYYKYNPILINPEIDGFISDSFRDFYLYNTVFN